MFLFEVDDKKLRLGWKMCRYLVEIAHKQVLVVVLVPEVEKNMYAQIVIDGQTQKENVGCNYCIEKVVSSV